MFTQSKDEVILDRQLKQKDLVLQADLVAQTSEVPGVLTISGAVATTTISANVQEPIKSCQSISVVNRITGAIIATTAAPLIAGNSVSVVVDATGITNACITIQYRN